MREKLHPTLIELWIGIVLWSILIAAIGIWFCKDKPAWGFGILLGMVTAFALAFYMTRSVGKLVDDLDAGRGDRVIRVSSMIRLGIAAAIIAIACVIPRVNPIGTFLGILSMKFAAYSNPLIHKVTPKLNPYFKDKEYPPEENEENIEEDNDKSEDSSTNELPNESSVESSSEEATDLAFPTD